MSKSWPKINALIITHIQMYEVIKLRDLKRKKKLKDVLLYVEKSVL